MFSGNADFVLEDATLRLTFFLCISDEPDSFASLSLKSQFYRLNLFKKICMLLLFFLQILFELPACLILLVCIIRHLNLKGMVIQGAKITTLQITAGS